MLAAFKCQIRKEYEERLDVQQRQIDDFQRRHVEDREELAGHLATHAPPIKSKGGSGEYPAGALGLRFLPLAFSSAGMRPRR